MADVPVERTGAPAETMVPDVWRSFRGEMDRLFDRFGFPSLRRILDMEPGWRPASSFTFPAPAIALALIDERIRANTKAMLDEAERTGVLPRIAATSLATERLRRAMRTRRWDGNPA